MRLLSDSESSVSSSDGSISTEEEAPSSRSDVPMIIVPPDCSDLSAIQTILTIDAWQNDKGKVAESLTRLANLCLEKYKQHKLRLPSFDECILQRSWFLLRVCKAGW